MKYGLMYYKYTDNMGDDIQTYVARKYLPHIDYYIDRESLSCFVPKEKEYVSMIMNGWYIHNKIAWPPSPYINPLLISMHFKNLKDTDVGDLYLKGYGGEFLKKYGPVGARDIETKKRLEANGIKSYFSGCMTLTLEKFKDVEKENKIYIVDVENDVIKKIEQNTDCEIEILSHFLEPKENAEKSIDERMENVENLLKKYQQAHLVITTRLHVMLPCVALNTPVILLHKKNYDKDRLGDFLEYVDSYTKDEFLNMDIKNLLKNPKPNSDSYLKIKESINAKCIDFIKKCGNNSNGNLPEIEDYKKSSKKIMWYKEIFEKERLALENIEIKRVEEFNLYHSQLELLNKEKDELMEHRNKLEDELEQEKKQNVKLSQELSNIYNSRGWKYLERIRRFL